MSSFVQEKKWDVSGTECNVDLVGAAIDCGFNVCHSDNLSVYEDGTFDLVVAFDVLEHIPRASLPDFVNEIKRILKGNGFFIARFPNGDSPFGLINQNGDVTHLTSIGSGMILFLSSLSKMKVIYLGSEAQPFIGTSALNFLHRLITRPIKYIFNVITNLIFFPRGRVSFYSFNLTAIFQKSK